MVIPSASNESTRPCPASGERQLCGPSNTIVAEFGKAAYAALTENEADLSSIIDSTPWLIGDAAHDSLEPLDRLSPGTVRGHR
jgi:hypothetical protein